jgi:hypothetical protein
MAIIRLRRFLQERTLRHYRYGKKRKKNCLLPDRDHSMTFKYKNLRKRYLYVFVLLFSASFNFEQSSLADKNIILKTILKNFTMCTLKAMC